jgi:Lrp/AsnC family transcriptional regulator for asnA, asnC and gidA
MSKNVNGVALDEVSRAIIEELQTDGRKPYAAIGAAVGLSEAAVRQRVSRMVDSGLIQIAAITNPLQVGFLRQAMIGITVQGDVEVVSQKISAIPEISYVVVTAGSFDVLAEVVCEDDDQLLDVVNRQIRAITGVVRSETFVYLKLAKQTYSWGTR